MKQEFTLTVFTENRAGVLSRVVGIITRRHINIESLSSSPSSIEGMHKIIVVINVTEELVKKVVASIDKQIDVMKAFHYRTEDIVHQEMALYKVPTAAFHEGDTVEQLVRKYDAKILRIEKEYIVIQKTGHQKETEALLDDLRQIGIYEFVRSGRVAIVKPMERLNNYMRKMNATAN